MSVRTGIKDGVLTVADEEAGTSVSIPWPPPPPKHGYGSWQPALLERFEDGTALALWRWEANGAPWQRADLPFSIPPWKQLLPRRSDGVQEQR